MITVNIDKCIICKSENTIIQDFNAGQIACTNCGAVLEDRVIDESSEWRNFSSENPGSSSADPNRVGGPINPHLDENNLCTTIATNKRNSALSKWKNRSIGGGGRCLYRIFKKVEELAGKLDIPVSIIEKSKDLLNQIEKQKKLKGRSLDCIIASVFFVACRDCNAHRPLKDLARTLSLEKKDVSRCFNSIKGIICQPNSSSVSDNTIALVNLFCNKMEIENKVKKAACEIAEEVCKKEIIAGRNPTTVASASIYFALKLFNDTERNIRTISQSAEITENTINSAYTQIYISRDLICPAIYREHLRNLEMKSDKKVLIN
jgi:transcription initiation factor TFIIB